MKTEEKIQIKGFYFKFDIAEWVKKDSSVLPVLRELSRKYENKAKMINDVAFRFLVQQGAILGVQEHCNLIATTGKTVFAMLLAGDTTYTGEINYGALGNGAGTLVAADTQLDNEIYRKLASSTEFDGNIAYIDWFIAAGDVGNQTFTQFGSFIDGTGAANSGQAFSLLSGLSWVKSGAMFISAKYTIS